MKPSPPARPPATHAHVHTCVCRLAVLCEAWRSSGSHSAVLRPLDVGRHVVAVAAVAYDELVVEAEAADRNLGQGRSTAQTLYLQTHTHTHTQCHTHTCASRAHLQAHTHTHTRQTLVLKLGPCVCVWFLLHGPPCDCVFVRSISLPGRGRSLAGVDVGQLGLRALVRVAGADVARGVARAARDDKVLDVRGGDDLGAVRARTRLGPAPARRLKKQAMHARASNTAAEESI